MIDACPTFLNTSLSLSLPLSPSDPQELVKLVEETQMQLSGSSGTFSDTVRRQRRSDSILKILDYIYHHTPFIRTHFIHTYWYTNLIILL